MAPSAVFVDPSGRRARWFARACWLAGALLAGYVALVVLSLVAPPGVTRLGLGPLLPRPVAPPLIDASGAPTAPKQLLLSPTPLPSARSSRSSTGTGGASSPTPGTGSPAPTPRPTAAPTAAGSPTPSGRPSPSGRPTTRATAHPTPVRTPPPHP